MGSGDYCRVVEIVIGRWRLGRAQGQLQRDCTRGVGAVRAIHGDLIFRPGRHIERDLGGVGFVVIESDKLERSEEHTSELQSLRHLVCRLLLEKKKRTSI